MFYTGPLSLNLRVKDFQNQKMAYSLVLNNNRRLKKSGGKAGTYSLDVVGDVYFLVLGVRAIITCAYR